MYFIFSFISTILLFLNYFSFIQNTVVYLPGEMKKMRFFFKSIDFFSFTILFYIYLHSTFISLTINKYRLHSNVVVRFFFKFFEYTIGFIWILRQFFKWIKELSDIKRHSLDNLILFESNFFFFQCKIRY